MVYVQNTNIFNENKANYVLNIILHVFILFTFLSIFFFSYISKLEKDSINRESTNLIKKSANDILEKIYKWDIKTNKAKTINWKEIYNIADNLEKNSQGEDPKISESNKSRFYIDIILIISVITLLIVLFIYFIYYKKYKINIKNIILENIIIFSFVGVIEFLFFSKVAVKYIPVTPDIISLTALERIKQKI